MLLQRTALRWQCKVWRRQVVNAGMGWTARSPKPRPRSMLLRSASGSVQPEALGRSRRGSSSSSGDSRIPRR